MLCSFLDSHNKPEMPSSKKRWLPTPGSEQEKLSYKEDDWNLAGSELKETRTRHGGMGRPKLDRRLLFEVELASSDENNLTLSENGDDDGSEADTAGGLKPLSKPRETRVTMEKAGLMNGCIEQLLPL